MRFTTETYRRIRRKLTLVCHPWLPSRRALCGGCRGTWARVTIEHFSRCCRGTWARVTIMHFRNYAQRCVRGKCAQQRRFSEWQLMRTLCRCRVCTLTGHWLGTCAARVHTVAQHSLYTVQHNLYTAQRSLYTAQRNLCTAQHNRCPTQMCAHCSPAQLVAPAEP